MQQMNNAQHGEIALVYKCFELWLASIVHSKPLGTQHVNCNRAKEA